MYIFLEYFDHIVEVFTLAKAEMFILLLIN